MPIPVESSTPAPVGVLDGRLRFPATDDRLAYEVHGPNLPIYAQSGKPVVIYSDAAGSVLADIVNNAGAAIAGSSLTVDNNSQIPEFFGPVGVEVLYARLNGGTAYPIYAWLQGRYNDYDAQFTALGVTDAALDTRVDTLEAYDISLDSRVSAVTAEVDQLQLTPSAENMVTKGSLVLNVKDYGAVGDGVTNDLVAIQTAINSLTEGGVVYFPLSIGSYYVNGPILMKPRVTLRGPGRYRAQGTVSSPRLIVGNGVAPVFLAGSYPSGSSSAANDTRLEGVTARNNGAPVLDLLTALNFTVDNCDLAAYIFASTDSGTIRGRYSYRGIITNSRVTCSGGAWAIDMRDNCNGVTISNNILTGGSAGGGVFVGQSQSVHTIRNVIESSKVGISYAAAGTNSGRCFGAQIDNNYIEACETPISVGTAFAVQGGSISENYIGNGGLGITTWAASTAYVAGKIVNNAGTYYQAPVGGVPARATFTPADWTVYVPTFIPQQALLLGRLSGVDVVNNQGAAQYLEPWIRVMYNAAAFGSIPAPESCRITGNYGEGAGSLYDISSYTNETTRPRFAGMNEVDTVTDGTQPKSGSRSWTSETIHLTAYAGSAGVSPPIAAGLVSTAVALDTVYGGWVDGVDIIAANGTIACTVDVGVSGAITEVASFDPSSLTLVNRSATFNVNKAWRTLTPLLVRVTVGAGTGSFRIRVRWQGA